WGAIPRASSPPSIRSTLTMSAPRSARIMVAVGPATTVLRSRIRTPVSGGGKELKIARARAPAAVRWTDRAASAQLHRLADGDCVRVCGALFLRESRGLLPVQISAGILGFAGASGRTGYLAEHARRRSAACLVG